MGGILSSCWRCLIGRQDPIKILLLGLDNAGKTTVLYRYKLQQTVKTTPTIGFNVEEVTFQNLKFCVWDVGGQDKVRNLWSYYYGDAKAIVFMIDSNDFGRLQQAKTELHKILESDCLPADAALLVLANKQDLPFAKSSEKISEEIGLSAIKGNRRTHIRGSNAIGGEGLYEGLTWLAKNI